MRTSYRYIGFTASLLLVVAAMPGHAARHPGRSSTSHGEPGRVNLLGETEFDCGTYKGNQAEHAWRGALDERIQKDVAAGKRVVQGGLDYVYDDVWIIQDDGSMTFSGTNAFDTDFRTYQFAPAGGGVYNITNPVFSYDGVLGTEVFTGDDGAELVGLDFAFPYGGDNWTEVYVSGNGIISFGLPPNPSGYFDPADFYSPTDKIAGYYMDLNPDASGGVNVKSEATKFTITWAAVPEYGVSGPLNTFQIVLFPSGNFTLTYNGMQTTLPSNANPIVVGYHPGGTPPFEVLSYSADVPYTSGAGAAVYEEYYSFGYPLVNEVALFQRFYSQFPDEFFQLVYFTNFIQTMSGFANELNIKNDVTGLGLDIFDSSAQYGSNGVLESRCNMNRLLAWTTADPYFRWFSKGNNFLTIMGQEAGHRWGAFAYFDSGSGPSNLILGRSDAHWSYFVDVDHSSLEGGNWQSTGGGNYVCPTRVDYFSELDEYLMGLRTPAEVKDFFYVSSPTNDHPSNRSVGTPLINATASGIEVPVTVEDIEAANGVRTPIEPNENKDLRQAFILLVAAGTSPTQADLDKIAGFRRAWEDYFEVSCDGRLTCNTSLTSNFPIAVVCGNVRDADTDLVIPEFTARSLERGFVQHVPDGGRYTFRYQANAASGPAENVTIVFEAADYEPDTLVASVAYGSTNCLDILLEPTLTPVFITSFEAVVVSGPAVDVRWELWSDEALSRYELHRYDGEYTPARLIASGDASARSFVDEAVEPGKSYRYELVIVAADGESARSPLVSVTMPELVTVLAQNYPNPFNPKTTIEYTLAARARVAVGIYDATGALVIRFDQGTRDAGTHRVEWSGNDASGKPVGSGVYFYRLEGVKGIAPRKMVLLK
ncbi:MAG: T9SS type A sorting domain-containing protein [Candidatus Latescibacteria bacterium]|nr:T9SS type A sorting domain-containing protein [Candidatus Latescibacterota bacterium]